MVLLICKPLFQITYLKFQILNKKVDQFMSSINNIIILLFIVKIICLHEDTKKIKIDTAYDAAHRICCGR